jgi:hypothetical protein
MDGGGMLLAKIRDWPNPGCYGWLSFGFSASLSSAIDKPGDQAGCDRDFIMLGSPACGMGLDFHQPGRLETGRRVQRGWVC